MRTRFHRIREWTGSLVEGSATVRCNCGWNHQATTSDAALAAYRDHKHDTLTKGYRT